MTEDKVLALAEQYEKPISLERATILANQLKEAHLKVADLTEQLAKAQAEVNRLSIDEIPTHFAELGIDHIGIPATGNEPAFDINVKRFVAASIPVGWPDARRAEAFAELAKHGGKDIIKTAVTVRIPAGNGSAQKAAAVIEAAQAADLSPEIKQDVHWGTLTSWVKSKLDSGNYDVDFDKIGAFVGHKAEIKPRSE